MWGKAAAGVVLAVSVAAVSGCSGDAETNDTKPAAVKTVSVTKASADFKAALADQDVTGCESMEPGTCWEQMGALLKPARTLRKAMNADKSGGPGFWTEAYAIINRMEKGYAVGEDEGGGANNTTTNRIAVFGGAHDLEDWLDEHPTK